MKSRQQLLMDYFEHSCDICRVRRHYVEHRRGQGYCFVCLGCSRGENIREALGRIYKQPLSRARADVRKKLLDMMARDVVREWKRRAVGGTRAAQEKNTQWDLMGVENDLSSGNDTK